MVLTKTQKQSIVAELTRALKDASVLVFVNFRGLSVTKMTRLRKELRQSGAQYTVVKKTLLKRVLDSLGFSDVPKLDGEVGLIAGSGEVTEPPRIVAKFIKEEKGGLTILGGVYESTFVDGDVIKRLSAIPPRETLIAQLAFMLTQPVAGLARALEEVRKKQSSVPI